MKGFFRLCNVNIVDFFTIYLIATYFGHTTIYFLELTLLTVVSKFLLEDGRITETCSN
jgi:hypothetical protein